MLDSTRAPKPPRRAGTCGVAMSTATAGATSAAAVTSSARPRWHSAEMTRVRRLLRARDRAIDRLMTTRRRLVDELRAAGFHGEANTAGDEIDRAWRAVDLVLFREFFDEVHSLMRKAAPRARC